MWRAVLIAGLALPLMACDSDNFPTEAQIAEMMPKNFPVRGTRLLTKDGEATCSKANPPESMDGKAAVFCNYSVTALEKVPSEVPRPPATGTFVILFQEQEDGTIAWGRGFYEPANFTHGDGSKTTFTFSDLN
ncbi:MAG: hypothetical protein AAF677_10475 [Pseudomonadota bacterium]